MDEDKNQNISQDAPSEAIEPSEPTSDSTMPDTDKEVASEESPTTDEEAAMVAGVATVGKISIWIAHIKRFFIVVWQNPKLRYSSLAAIALLLTVLFAWPTSRNGIFNTAGLRAAASIHVIDQETKAPVANALIHIDDNTYETNEDGTAELESIKLGVREVTVSKLAYAESTSEISIGFGSNTLNDFEIQPIGSQFDFKVIDWLNKLPLEDAKITYGDVLVKTDSDGVAVLNIPPTEDTKITVTIEADDYTSQETEINTVENKENEILLTADTPHYFISNRNGSYDIYSSHLDGSEEKLLIPGTGFESKDLTFSIDSTNTYGALASTRTGQRDDDGALINSLHLVNLAEGEIKLVDQSRQVQLIEWIGEKLIYVKINSGESTLSPSRHLLMEYDTKTKKSSELEASNHFNDVRVIQGQIYYAADGSFKQEKPKPYLYQIDPDGTNRTTVIDKRTWTIFQEDYNQLIVNADDNSWFRYKINEDELIELAGLPPNLDDHRFFDGPKTEKSLWVDQRDGKGVLVVRNTETGAEEIAARMSGLQEPVRWLDENRILFRISNDQETADYIVDLRGGGEPFKITNTSAVSSTSRWFYY